MIRIWTWACIGITGFFVVACSIAFADFYQQLGTPSAAPVEMSFLKEIGYVVGERIFNFGESLPGLAYVVIIGHPKLFASGLLVVLSGVGSGIWLCGILIARIVGAGLERRRRRLTAPFIGDDH